MSDINVTLGADISDYSNKLKAAEAQALGFSTKVTTGLNSLQASVDKINGKFQGLTHALVGVGMVEFVHSLLEGANQLKDMADGLGVTIPRFMEMRLAATESGSSIEGMAKMLAKMEQSASNAADGNLQLRDTYSKIGISVRDMMTLSPDQLFLKTAKGLSEITNAGERTRIKIELLGKSAFAFDPASFVASVEKYYGTMEKYGESQEQAARLSEQLKLKTEMVRSAFLELISPIFDVTNGTKSAAEQMSNAKNIAVALGVAMGVFATSAVINAFGNIATAVKGLTTWLLGQTAATEVNTVATQQNTSEMLLNANMAIYMAGAHGRLGRAQATLAAAEEELALARAAGIVDVQILEKLEDKIALARDRVLIATKALAKVEEELAAGRALGNKVTEEGILVENKRGDAIEKNMEKARKASIEMRLLALAATALYSSELNQGEDKVLERNRKALEQYQKLSEADKKLVDQLKLRNGPGDMVRAQEILKSGTSSGNGTVGGDKNPILDSIKARIAAIGDETTAINKSNQRAIDRIKLEGELAGQIQTERDAKLAAFDAETKFLNEIATINKQINSVKTEMAGKDGSEKKYLEQVVKAYEEQRNAIKNVSKDTEELKKKQAEAARSWSAGWNKAFNEYIDNATNAASVAENLFKKATQGMEDAIVKFAKTGKFEFKNFVAMMAEELLRSQVRQLMANVMLGAKSMAGGGGILSGVGKLLGFASGGVVGQNQPILVGERGPEMFVPPSNGNIIPNNQIAGGGSVTLNINAVDAPSFQALVARNPQFIHAVAEMGRRSIPGNR